MLIVLVITTSSCSGRIDKEKEVLSSLLGREIVIPDGLECRIQNTPIDYDMSEADYKIITYIDSAGCVPCRMKLSFWNDIIDEFRSLDGIEVGFLMILNTRQLEEMTEVLVNDKFLHPVCFDSESLFENANSLPSRDSYHTFLLNADNEIVAVGNPSSNPKVKDIYRQVITSDIDNNPIVSLLCRRPVATLGLIESGDTIVRRFQLRNTGDSSLSIQALIPSCYCVSAEVKDSTIGPDDVVMVTVTYLPDSVSGPTRRHIDVFYNETNDPERLTLHGFIVN